MNKKNKTAIVLLLVIAMALIVSALDKGTMLGIFDRTRRNPAPADKPESLFYNRKKPCTSANVVDRSGFAFLNLRQRIVAIELASGIKVNVVTGEESGAPYEKFSEYAGYIYLFDGDSLWRTGVDGKRVSHIADGVIDYEPMGDHVYFIKTYQDEPRLFRSWLNGSGQEVLFDFPVHEFRAFAGNLLMLREPRQDNREQRYTRYNVVDRSRADLALPAGATEPSLGETTLYYVVVDDGEPALYRRSLSARDESAELVGRGFLDWQAGPDGVAMLVPDGEGSRLRYVDGATGGERLSDRRFAFDAAVDLSWDRVYVTEVDGIHHSPVSDEDWRSLPLAAERVDRAAHAEPTTRTGRGGNQGVG